MITALGINIIIANIVSVGDLIFSFWKHATINRKKQLILLIIQCILCSISYLLLHTYTALATNIFAILKYLYMIKFHKEEKVKLSVLENCLLNAPYFIFAFIFFKNDGWWGFFYAVTGTIDDSRFALKSDATNQLVAVFTQVCYVIYHIFIMDFVKAFKQIINASLSMINYIRIKKHGEDYFYHSMRENINKKEGDKDA